MTPAASHDSQLESLIGRLADEYADRLARGERPDVEEDARQYPELAETLRRMIPAIEAMQALSQSTIAHGGLLADDAAAPESGTLGDFRILREIGRGGMGVVYEAEQISLKRRVALKVLPFAAVLDERRLQRFRNEAMAAAQLHHTNIVPVYAVSCERGVHYYAMQYIEGLTLEQIIRQLAVERQTPKIEPVLDEPTPNAAATPHPAIASPESSNGSRVASQASNSRPNTHPLAAFSTDAARHKKEWFHAVARIGMQVADALDHAHNLGITHRDIKPSNLILDAQGHVWVTDFGLAQIETEANLTMTGDVLGTLRYMSPEQARGQRGVLDHRTDVYSLGATLYELAVLYPAFTAHDRAALLRQVMEDDPPPARQLAPAIPRDLETIILKALAKNPGERYETARALANDLRRHLENCPVLARRPTWLEILVKWSRRHWVIVAAVFATLLLTTLVSSVAAVAVWRQAQETQSALEAAKVKTREAQFQSARLALDRGLSMCDDGDVARGLSWMAYALQHCPVEKNEFGRVVRANIGSWSKRIHPLEMVLDHPRSVASVHFTPDGQKLVTSCHDGRIRIWNAELGDLIHVIQVEEPQGALSLAVHPQGKLLAVGDWSGNLHLLDVETGKPRVPPRTHSRSNEDRKRVDKLAFSPDGELILACSADGQARFWPTSGEAAQGEIMLHPHHNYQLSFSPDGQTALTATRYGEVLGWKVPSGESLGTLVSLPHDVAHGFTWQDAGRTLIVAGENFGASVWDRETGELAPRRFPHLARVNAVAACEEPSLVATGSDDRTAQIWQWPSAAPWGARIDCHADVSYVAFDQRGERLATAARTQVQVWRIAVPELPTPELVGIGELPTIRLSADGSIVYAVGEDARVHAWRTDTGAPTGLAEGADVRSFAISPDGERLLWSSRSEMAALRLDTGERIWRRPTSSVLSFSFSVADTNRQVLAYDTWTPALLINSETGEIVRTLGGRENADVCAAFRLDGRLAAVGDREGRVRIWDLPKGTMLGVPLRHRDEACDVTFSPQGDVLWVGTKNGQTAAWDIATQRPTGPPTQLPAAYRWMGFHPHGILALGFAGDGTAQFFDVYTGIRVGPPLIHYGRVGDVAYTADGRIVATRGPNRDIRYWRVPEPTEGRAAEICQGIEALTGLALDDNETIVHLDGPAWRERLTNSRRTAPVRPPVVPPEPRNMATEGIGESRTTQAPDN